MNEWEALRQECLSCHACTLADTRQNVVFGVGRPDAEVMFIGEAPGANEDMQGEPFVGRGGKLHLHHQLRQVPPAGEPRSDEYGEGRVQRLPAAAAGADEAQDHRVPRPHQRHGADPP